MKRVKIISDITFDLIANKIDSKNFVISDIVYSDSIISTLLSSKDQFKEIDFLVIHFDTFFHRYNEEFLVTLLKTIESISSSFIGNILISNNFISVEPPSFLKKNIGQDTQFVLSNGLLLEKIINISNIFMYDFYR